jgi:hypothetical protein
LIADQSIVLVFVSLACVFTWRVLVCANEKVAVQKWVEVKRLHEEANTASEKQRPPELGASPLLLANPTCLPAGR